MKKYMVQFRSDSNPSGEAPFYILLDPLNREGSKKYDTKAAFEAELAACGVGSDGIENILSLLVRKGIIREAEIDLTPEGVALLCQPS